MTGLNNGTTYMIVLRAVSASGSGANSPPVTVMPLGDTTPDTDGVTASTEDPVPSATGGGLGDGNGDGVQDRLQSNVTSLPSATGAYVTAAVSGTGITLSAVVAAATPADFPSDSTAPLSGLALTINGVAPGASQVVDMYFPSDSGVLGVMKRNQRTGAFDVMPATRTFLGNKIKLSFTLTDGDDYDADRVVNGAIQDPAFPFFTSGGGSGGGGGALNPALLGLLMLAGLLRRRKNHAPA